MYRRSLNRIVKARILASPEKLGSVYRYNHAGYGRSISLLKYDDLRKDRNNCVLSTDSRNFGSEYIKKDGIESDTPEPKPGKIGIDLMAPTFKNSYCIVKSITKNRKEIGGKFHTMAQKSLILRICNQPSKPFSTIQPKDGTAKAAQSNQNVKNEEKRVNIAIADDEAEICRIICNQKLSPSPENSAMKTSQNTLRTAALKKSKNPNPSGTVPLKVCSNLNSIETSAMKKSKDPNTSVSPELKASLSHPVTVALKPISNLPETAKTLPNPNPETAALKTPNLFTPATSKTSTNPNPPGSASLKACSTLNPIDTSAMKRSTKINTFESPELKASLNHPVTVALKAPSNHPETAQILPNPYPEIAVSKTSPNLSIAATSKTSTNPNSPVTVALKPPANPIVPETAIPLPIPNPEATALKTSPSPSKPASKTSTNHCGTDPLKACSTLNPMENSALRRSTNTNTPESPELKASLNHPVTVALKSPTNLPETAKILPNPNPKTAALKTSPNPSKPASKTSTNPNSPVTVAPSNPKTAVLKTSPNPKPASKTTNTNPTVTVALKAPSNSISPVAAKTSPTINAETAALKSSPNSSISAASKTSNPNTIVTTASKAPSNSIPTVAAKTLPTINSETAALKTTTSKLPESPGSKSSLNPNTVTAANAKILLDTNPKTTVLKTAQMHPSETTASTKTPNQQSTESIIDKLTAAEIDYICKTRCPCTNCNELEKINKQARVVYTIHPTKKGEDPIMTIKKTDTRKNRIDFRSSQIRKKILPNNNGNIPRDTRYKLNPPPNHYKKIPREVRYDSNMANLMRTEDKLRQGPASGALCPMLPMPYKPPRQSKYDIMIRSQAKDQKHRLQPASQQNTHPVPMVPINLPSNSVHLEPLPIQPMYNQNHHSNPVTGTAFISEYNVWTSPSVDSTYVSVSLRPAKQFVSKMRPRRQLRPTVIGRRQNRKNKQTFFNLQSNLPELSDRTKFPEQNVNNSRTTTDIGKVVEVTISNNIVNHSLDKIKSLAADSTKQPKKVTNLSISNNIVNSPDKIKSLAADSTKELKKVIDLPISNNIVNSPDKIKSLAAYSAKQSKKVITKLMENQSVIIERPGKLKLVTSSYPEMRDERDVIIQMEYVNLTHSDMQHYLTGKYTTYSFATTIAGRTGTGTITEIGKDVQNVKPGDKVFVKPVSCGKCQLCLSDRRNLCEYVCASEKSPTHGTLSRYHVHSSDYITKIPHNVNLSNAAVIWTLSSAIRACQKAELSAGDVVMVIGGGPLGIATCLAAQSMGATSVCLSDTRNTFLEKAESFGIDRVFLIDPKSPSRNTAIKMWEFIGDYPCLTFDCRASELTNQIAIDATKTGGKVVVMNNSGRECALPISNIITRDIDIIISTIGNDESDLAALQYLSTEKVSSNDIMCKFYDLSDVHEAFNHLQSPNRLDFDIIVKCFSKAEIQENKAAKETK